MLGRIHTKRCNKVNNMHIDFRKMKIDDFSKEVFHGENVSTTTVQTFFFLATSHKSTSKLDIRTLKKNLPE